MSEQSATSATAEQPLEPVEMPTTSSQNIFQETFKESKGAKPSQPFTFVGKYTTLVGKKRQKTQEEADRDTVQLVLEALNKVNEELRRFRAQSAEQTKEIYELKCEIRTLTQQGNKTKTSKALVEAIASKKELNKQSEITAAVAKISMPKGATEPAKPQTYAEIIKKGNIRPATETPSKPVVGSKRIMGSRKDTVVITTDSQTDQDENAVMEKDEKLMKDLFLPPPREPQTLNTVVFKLDRVIPKQTKQWRECLKNQGIKTYSIFRPSATSVEILMSQAESQKMREFLAKVQAKSVHPDPFKVNNGQTQITDQQTIQAIIERRLRMMEQELSGAGMGYLQTVIEKGITLIPEKSIAKQMQDKLEEVLKQRKWGIMNVL